MKMFTLSDKMGLLTIFGAPRFLGKYKPKILESVCVCVCVCVFRLYCQQGVVMRLVQSAQRAIAR